MRILFDWLDAHPGSYWATALGPTLLLFGWIWVAAWRESRGLAASAPGPRVKWGDALVLFLFLLAWRWPFLLVANEFNPDESQFITGATTLAHDPVFWRSVDGHTSGPLNFYILLPLRWLGLPPGYFAARLTGLLLVCGALFFCHRTLAGVFGRAIAWLGVLPVAGFFATATHPDLIHYSSEHVSLLLIALAGWLLTGRQPGDQRRLWAACAVAGALPWAKLQSAPVSVALIGWGLWQAVREPGVARKLRMRRAAGAALAAGAPTLLAAALLAGTGQMEAVVRRYFVQNLLYVDTGHRLGDTLPVMTSHAMVDGRLPLLLATTLVMLLATAFYLAVRRRRPPALLAAAGFLTLAAAVAVVAPRRESLHYALFLTVPLALWLGAAMGVWWTGLSSARSRLVLAGLLFFLAGLPPVITRGFQPVPAIYGRFAYHWDHPRAGAAVVIRELAGEGDFLAIWGWANNLYVESGLPEATRDANSTWLIIPHAQRDYFRSCYLADLRRHQPSVFVDAVGPKAFCFGNRLAEAHEIFPELADYVRQNYTLVVDLGKARIYARNGLPALRDASPARLNRLIAQGYAESYFEITWHTSVSPDKLERKAVAGRPVTVLPSSIPVVWPLDDEVREVSFEFGCDPAAGEKGRSHGARLNLQLMDDPYALPVYGRLLDPVRRPGDRGLQVVRLVLPPFNSGALLVLQADPGPAGHRTDDPVYFTELQFSHNSGYIPEQFPGFNRVPDFLAADCSNLKGEGSARYLVLHPPGFLVYKLGGNERRMRFDYGLDSDPPSGANPLEMAVFRVELHRPGQPMEILFERLLQPAASPADQGRQHAEMTLPVFRPGDRLMLTVSPGSLNNIGLNWIYLRSLVLE